MSECYMLSEDRFCNMYLIPVHAPTKESGDNEKIIFMVYWRRLMTSFLHMMSK